MCPCTGASGLVNAAQSEGETVSQRHDTALVLALLVMLAVNIASWIAYIGA